MQGYDNVLEKDCVLVSEWDSESADDAGQNIQKLGRSVEFMVLVDECKETLINCLSDHFPSWYKFCIEFVKNVL